MILPGEVLQKLKIKHVKGQNTSKFYIAEFVSETNIVYIYYRIEVVVVMIIVINDYDNEHTHGNKQNDNTNTNSNDNSI